MTSDADFDPISVADALPLLASELRAATGPEQARGLIRLKAELATVVTQARAWASRHDIAIECVPLPPADSASRRECLESLHDLATVLRHLGSYVALSSVMPDLIEKIRASDAMRKLGDVKRAVDDACSGLTALKDEAKQLHDELQQITGQSVELTRMRDRVNNILWAADMVLVGLGNLRRTLSSGA